MEQTKKSPVLGDDAWIYQVTKAEVDFVFASRDKMDWGDGRRFSAEFARRKHWSVGLIPFDRDEEGEGRLTHLFDTCVDIGGKFLYGCAAVEKVILGPPASSIDRRAFSPPLVGKVSANIDGFISVRRSLIGVYSGCYYLFSSKLEWALLDVNGYYTLIAGPRALVEASTRFKKKLHLTSA